MTVRPEGLEVEPANRENEEEVAALENAGVTSEPAKAIDVAAFAALVSPAEHLAVLETGMCLAVGKGTVPAQVASLETELATLRQSMLLQRRLWSMPLEFERQHKPHSCCRPCSFL